MSGLVVPQGGLVGTDGRPMAAKTTVYEFNEESELRNLVLSDIGDLADLDIAFGDVLVWKYQRTMVSTNLLAAPETQKEDIWQGVIGLVLKVGPLAFQDDEHNKFGGFRVERGDWVLFRNSDGWGKGVQIIGELRMAECRFLADAHIRAKVKYPARWF